MKQRVYQVGATKALKSTLRSVQGTANSLGRLEHDVRVESWPKWDGGWLVEDQECQMKEFGPYPADSEGLKKDVEMIEAGQLTEAVLSKHPLLLVRSDYKQVIPKLVVFLNSTSAAKSYFKNYTLSFTNEWVLPSHFSHVRLFVTL